jgi:hypothetical protein
MPFVQRDGGAAVVNGVLYVIGGQGGCGSVIANVEAYDPVTDTWTAKAPLPEPATSFGVGVVNGIIYVVGGGNLSGFLAHTYAYDPASDSWTAKEQIPVPRGGSGVTVLNGKIYVVGGNDSNGGLSTVQAYDPISDTWTSKAPLLSARAALAAGVANGKLYAIGGYDVNNTVLASVDAYDPTTDSWTADAPMQTPRAYFTSVSLNNTVYVFGGWNGSTLSSVEAFQATVGNTPPTADAHAPYTVAEGGVAQLLGTGNDPDGDSLTYSWDLDNNGTFETIDQNPTFSAAGRDGPDSQIVKLKVCDTAGACDIATTAVAITNVAPVATLNAPASLTFGSSLTESLSGPSDPSGQDSTAGFHYAFAYNTVNASPLSGANYGNSGTTSSTTFPGLSIGTYYVFGRIIDKDGGFTEYSKQVSVSLGAGSIYVLNASAPGSLSISGNGTINSGGVVVVDSSATNAVVASGNAAVTANGVLVVGGVSKSGNAVVTKTGTPGATSDPLASLPSPTPGALLPAVAVSGSNAITIGPGTYPSLKVSGNGKLTLQPGIYFIAGGGISVTGNGSLTTGAGYSPDTGAGVLIYNAGNASGNFGGIDLSGNGAFNLTAPTLGTYQGILVFEARDNTRAISFGGNGGVGIAPGSTIYAKSALLALGGNSTLQSQVSLVVDRYQISGNGSSSLTTDGVGGSGSTAGELLAKDLYVYVNDPAGYLNAAARSRLDDAVASLDVLLAPYDVLVTETTDYSAANLVVTPATTSPAGGYADGVLGCHASTGELTLIEGWNWYVGADPAGIGSGQYDFQTIVTHELGHALGLGHNADADSVMYATLATGAVKRAMTAGDLNIPDGEGGNDPLLAAGFARSEAEPRRHAMRGIGLISGPTSLSIPERSILTGASQTIRPFEWPDARSTEGGTRGVAGQATAPRKTVVRGGQSLDALAWSALNELDLEGQLP